MPKLGFWVSVIVVAGLNAFSADDSTGHNGSVNKT
jgi:hypothetical protein